MQPIVPPIRPNDTGPAVSNLQEGLLTLINAKVIPFLTRNGTRLRGRKQRAYDSDFRPTTEALIRNFAYSITSLPAAMWTTRPPLD